MNEVTKANQRLVDEAYKHINATGKPSLSDEGTCTYAGSGCAFAPAIRPEYREDIVLKDKNVYGIFRSQRLTHLLEPWARHLDSNFAYDVQACHDEFAEMVADDSEFTNKHFVQDFNSALARLCSEHPDITYPGENDE